MNNLGDTINDKIEKSSNTVSSNGGWHHYSEDSNLVLIFVHGFLSSSAVCWLSENGVYWPTLITEESNMAKASIFLGGYYTKINSHDYGIMDCANELYSSLTMRQSNGSRSPLDFLNIIFVCHSLGGIVTRYLLETNKKTLSGKSIGLALLASPSLGSKYADALNGIARYFRNNIGLNLGKKSDLLIDMDHRFRIFLDDKNDFQIVGTEVVETQGTLIAWLPIIVEKQSAARYFGNPTRIPESNHSTVVKPTDRNHASHRHLMNFISGKFGAIFQESPPDSLLSTSIESKQNNDIPTRALVSKVLFDVYDKSCAAYYFNREIDLELASVLSFYSLWLSGPTGAGKTSLIKHLLGSVCNKPIELSLSHRVSELTGEICMTEISDTCLQLEIGNIQKSSSKLLWLSEILAEYSKKSPIVLYLDEVPIHDNPDDNFYSFIEFISNLLVSVKQKSGVGTHFIISSIGKPQLSLSPKLMEQVVLRDMPNWTAEELHGLYLIISTTLPNLTLDPYFIFKLIDKCNGSPRFLKTFFRNRTIDSTIRHSNDDILQSTIDQFKWQNNAN